MADILVLITIILVIFYAKEIKKTISSKFIMIFFQVREPLRNPKEMAPLIASLPLQGNPLSPSGWPRRAATTVTRGGPESGRPFILTSDVHCKVYCFVSQRYISWSAI